jgi:DNA-binding winged helix-turn-helix (wHTH) protein/tetratricopeptide (TPR) repeat protein
LPPDDPAVTVPPDDRPAVLLRFGVFELDLAAGELRRSGRRVHLARQPLVLLTALVTRPGELVERETVRALLWPAGTHVEFEAGLNFVVNRLRRALGDRPRTPHFVETITGRGYRFVHPVEVIRRSEPPPMRVRPDRRTGWGWPVIGLVAALLVQSAGALRESRVHQAAPPSPVAAAQRAFERGRAQLDGGPEGWRESLGSFTEATRLDPSFAVAFYGLADAYLRLAESREMPAAAAYPEARRAARRALALEDRAEVRVVLGAVRRTWDWDWAGALEEFRHARELDPALLTAARLESQLLTAAGRHDEAIRAMRDVVAREPGCHEMQRDLGWSYYRARRYEEAAEAWREWARLAPRQKEAQDRLFYAYRASGRLADAVAAARTVYVLAGVPDDRVQRFASRPVDRVVEDYLRGNLAYMSGGAIPGAQPDDFAMLHAALGDGGAALGELERAADERSPALLITLADPVFDPWRAEPRFVRLLARVGSPLLAVPPSALRIAALLP